MMNCDCTDIDECDMMNGNCSDSCTNTVGSFTCSCDNLVGRFELGSDERTCIGLFVSFLDVHCHICTHLIFSSL